ncbi:hypothetical protein [Nocardioides sp.]|uniref:hypothetical protein n=1 Tax=Nocardioides sp. TaxID=35761 RepID=UPI0025E047C1|nr:hypothetical protein [Nocardioides sp.]
MPTETPTTPSADQETLARRAEFEEAVAGHRRKGGAASGDRPLLVVGGLLMVGGLIGSFVQYNVTLAQDDPRDIASTQVLAIALLVLAVVGAALFVAGSLGRLLRLWLLRQLLENRERDERLMARLDAASSHWERD